MTCSHPVKTTVHENEGTMARGLGAVAVEKRNFPVQSVAI